VSGLREVLFDLAELLDTNRIVPVAIFHCPVLDATVCNWAATVTPIWTSTISVANSTVWRLPTISTATTL
jgi:hypothetical protein